MYHLNQIYIDIRVEHLIRRDGFCVRTGLKFGSEKQCVVSPLLAIREYLH